MAGKVELNKTSKAILGKNAEKVGSFREDTGGGTPIPKGEKLADHPEIKRDHTQPRNRDGTFGYKANNGRELKYGPSRGKTKPAILEGLQLLYVEKGMILKVGEAEYLIMNIDMTEEQLIESFKHFVASEKGFAGLTSEASFEKSKSGRPIDYEKAKKNVADFATINEARDKVLSDMGKNPEDLKHNPALAAAVEAKAQELWANRYEFHDKKDFDSYTGGINKEVITKDEEGNKVGKTVAKKIYEDKKQKGDDLENEVLVGHDKGELSKYGISTETLKNPDGTIARNPDGSAKTVSTIDFDKVETIKIGKSEVKVALFTDKNGKKFITDKNGRPVIIDGNTKRYAKQNELDIEYLKDANGNPIIDKMTGNPMPKPTALNDNTTDVGGADYFDRVGASKSVINKSREAEAKYNAEQSQLNESDYGIGDINEPDSEGKGLGLGGTKRWNRTAVTPEQVQNRKEWRARIKRFRFDYRKKPTVAPSNKKFAKAVDDAKKLFSEKDKEAAKTSKESFLNTYQSEINRILDLAKAFDMQTEVNDDAIIDYIASEKASSFDDIYKDLRDGISNAVDEWLSKKENADLRKSNDDIILEEMANSLGLNLDNKIAFEVSKDIIKELKQADKLYNQ